MQEKRKVGRGRTKIAFPPVAVASFEGIITVRDPAHSTHCLPTETKTKKSKRNKKTHTLYFLGNLPHPGVLRKKPVKK